MREISKISITHTKQGETIYKRQEMIYKENLTVISQNRCGWLLMDGVPLQQVILVLRYVCTSFTLDYSYIFA